VVIAVKAIDGFSCDEDLALVFSFEEIVSSLSEK